MRFINVRGCNGSGKTTLLREFGKMPGCFVSPVSVTHEIKNKDESGKVRVNHPPIPVTYCPNGVAILGDYTPAAAGATTAGCDRIKTQEATKNALERIARNERVKFILFEGIVVSTIYGPWKEWAEANGGMAWAFLDTPLDLCLKRVQERNGGKPVKEDQIADKHATIGRVQHKAFTDGQTVLNLDYNKPLADLLDYMGVEMS